MKAFLTLAVIITGIAALPNPEQLPSILVDERIVTSQIVKYIESICQSIREAGLDPLYIEKLRGLYGLPVPIIFNTDTFAEEVASNGLSNVLILRMSYSLLSSRLNFEIEMPLIDFSVRAASSEVTIFGNKLDVKGSGKVEITKIRIVGVVRVNIGVVSGITIRSIDAALTLGGINSDVNLVIQGQDYSKEVNEIIGSTIPDKLVEFSDEVNELLEIVLLKIINAKLQNI